jgi:hypothetical protein
VKNLKYYSKQHGTERLVYQKESTFNYFGGGRSCTVFYTLTGKMKINIIITGVSVS